MSNYTCLVIVKKECYIKIKVYSFVDKDSTTCRQELNDLSTRTRRLATSCRHIVDICQQVVDKSLSMSTSCIQVVYKLSTRCRQLVDTVEFPSGK